MLYCIIVREVTTQKKLLTHDLNSRNHKRVYVIGVCVELEKIFHDFWAQSIFNFEHQYSHQLNIPMMDTN